MIEGMKSEVGEIWGKSAVSPFKHHDKVSYTLLYTQINAGEV